MNAVELPLLMRKLSVALEELSSEQIDEILKDEVRLKIELVPRRTRGADSHEFADIEDYVNKLHAMNNRQSGIELLEGLKKTALYALAKRFQLSVDSSFSKERLTERIVERSIGLRLRQDAFAQLQ